MTTQLNYERHTGVSESLCDHNMESLLPPASKGGLSHPPGSRWEFYPSLDLGPKHAYGLLGSSG